MKYFIPLVVVLASLIAFCQNRVSSPSKQPDESAKVKACSTIKAANLEIDPIQYIAKYKWVSTGNDSTTVSMGKKDPAPAITSGETYYQNSQHTPEFTIIRSPSSGIGCDVGRIQVDLSKKFYVMGEDCPNFTISILRDIEKENYHEWVILRTCPLRQRTHLPETKLTRYVGGKNVLIGMHYVFASMIKPEELETIVSDLESIPIIVDGHSSTPQTPLPTPEAPKPVPAPQ
jgi:hypothetical protein